MKIEDNFLSISKNGLNLRLYAEQNIESKKETEELICSLSDNISKVSEFIKTLILALKPYNPCKVMIRTKAEVKEVAKILFKAGIKEFQIKNPEKDDLIMAINGNLYETFAIETQNLSSKFFTVSKTKEKTEIFTKSCFSCSQIFFLSIQKSQVQQFSQTFSKSVSSQKYSKINFFLQPG